MLPATGDRGEVPVSAAFERLLGDASATGGDGSAIVLRVDAWAGLDTILRAVEGAIGDPRAMAEALLHIARLLPHDRRLPLEHEVSLAFVAGARFHRAIPGRIMFAGEGEEVRPTEIAGWNFSGGEYVRTTSSLDVIMTRVLRDRCARYGVKDPR